MATSSTLPAIVNQFNNAFQPPNFSDTHSSQEDMTAAIMQSRRFSSNYNLPFTFNDCVASTNEQDDKTSPVDMYRATSDYRENQPMNHFTFNQSITHVNLINPRFPVNLPSHQGYNQSSFHSQENINLPAHNDMFFKPEQRGLYDEAPYSGPPPLLNNVSSMSNSTDHILNYNLPHHNYSHNLKEDHLSNDFKFDIPMNSPNIPNIIQNARPKSELNHFYGNHGISSANNINNNIFPTPPNFIQPMEKMSNLFLSNSGNKNKDHDIEQVEDTQKCKNTIEGTKTSVRRFKKWYTERYNKELDMNSVNRFNAPELLKDFFMDIRDTRPGRVGNEYEPVTLTTYRNGLRRYFLYRKVPPAPDNFDLTDKSFDLVNRHLVNKRDDLKRSGKGNHPNAVESITPEQLEKMWASGAIGTHAPRPLLRLMWWYNTVFHGVRGRMAHHDLSTEDFIIQRALDGKLLMEYTKNKPLLNLSSSGDESKHEPKKKRFKGMARETDGGERDPIRAFEIFKAHRPPGISSFYLTPKHKPKGSVWFNKVPMGKNSIGRIMREIKAIANI